MKFFCWPFFMITLITCLQKYSFIQQSISSKRILQSTLKYTKIVSKSSFTVIVKQMPSQNNNTQVIYQLKFNQNSANYSQIQYALRLYIDNQIQNYIFTKPKQFWIQVAFTKPAYLTQNSCILFVLDNTLLTTFSYYYTISDCQSYKNYESNLTNIASNNETNANNSSNSSNLNQNNSNINSLNIQNNSASNSALSMKNNTQTVATVNACTKIVSTYTNLAFKGAIIFGFSSFFFSFLNFINLIAIYYLLPSFQIPYRTSQTLKSILQGTTSGFILPDNSFYFMSTSLEIDQFYLDFSFTRNFLSFFMQSLILYATFDVIRRIKNYFFFNKKTHDNQTFFLLNFVSAMPICFLGTILNLYNQINFSKSLDKINFFGYLLLLTFLEAVWCYYVLLLLSQKQKKSIQELFMGFKIGQKNKRSQKIVVLQLCLLFFMPSLIICNFYAFWVINGLIMIILLTFTININSYQNFFILIVKSVSKIILFSHHTIFMLYKFIQSEEILNWIDTINFYLIVIAFSLEIVNLFIQLGIQIYQTFRSIKIKYFSLKIKKDKQQLNELKQKVKAKVKSESQEGQLETKNWQKQKIFSIRKKLSIPQIIKNQLKKQQSNEIQIKSNCSEDSTKIQNKLKLISIFYKALPRNNPFKTKKISPINQSKVKQILSQNLTKQNLTQIVQSMNSTKVQISILRHKKRNQNPSNLYQFRKTRLKQSLQIKFNKKQNLSYNQVQNITL